MMGKLMYYCIPETQKSLCAYFIFEQIEVVEGYDSCILHGSPFVFMGKDLIILRKRVFVSKIFLEK